MGLFMLDPRWALNLLFVFVNCTNLPFIKKKPPHRVRLSLLLIFGALSALILPAYTCGNFGTGLNFSDGLALGGKLWVTALVIAGVCTIFTLESPSDERTI